MKERTLSGWIWTATVSLAALTLSQAAVAAPGLFAQPDRVRQYDLQVSHKNLVAANAEIDADDLAALKPDGSLGAYPIASFAWFSAEKALNAYPQYLGRVDGIDLPFYYVAGEGRKPPVLLLTQSVPGSILQLLASADSLTHPSRHGGKAADAVTLVIAALPGSSFSALTRAATSDAATAALWNELLTGVIGVPRYQVHGEGLGGGVAKALLRQYPKTVTPSRLGTPAAADDDALLADLLLSRLDQNGMERNMRLFAVAQTHGDQGFWPNAISNPIVLAKMKVEVSDAIKDKAKATE
jgi:hypothetical protein